MNKPWNFIKSVRLSIFLFILLAAAALLGTLIPQQEQAMPFAERLSPALVPVFMRLGLFDLYHALWFRLIMALLALNLLACSLDRFPKSWKLFRAEPKADRSQAFENLVPERMLTVSSPKDETGALVLACLKKCFHTVQSEANEGRIFMQAEKGRCSYLGVYPVHLSVLLILLGALLGSLFGFEGFVNLGEGVTANSVILRKNGIPLGLDFSLRCDKFSITRYEDGTIREYRSDLSFLVDQKTVLGKSVKVNHPVRFRGITFYQAGYGTYVGEKALLHISRPDHSRAETALEAALGQVLPLPGGGTFSVTEIEDDFMNLGPAVQITLHPEAKTEMQFWIFQDQEYIERVKKEHPGMLDPLLPPAGARDYRLVLDERYYTVLQANRDPGVPLVWVGFLMLVLGLPFAFFTSHRQFRVRIEEKQGQTLVAFACQSNKNRSATEKKLNALMREVQKRLISPDSDKPGSLPGQNFLGI